MRMLPPFSVDKILLTEYMYGSADFWALPFNQGDCTRLDKTVEFCFIWIHVGILFYLNLHRDQSFLQPDPGSAKENQLGHVYLDKELDDLHQ